MIKLIPILVECHSGYKADEYPKCFYQGNEKIEIQEIIDRWYQGSNNPEWLVLNYFKAVTKAGEQFVIKHDLESDLRYLCEKNS